MKRSTAQCFALHTENQSLSLFCQQIEAVGQLVVQGEQKQLKTQDMVPSPTRAGEAEDREG